MSATRLSTAAPTASSVVAETLREEASTWLFVAKTLLAFFVTGWIAMRLDQEDTDWDRVADRIAQSWEFVAPRRLLEAGGR